MMKYRPEIDGLRAVAVVPVILFHGGLGPFSGGYVGVDVFFVLSGYLITTIIITDLEQDRFSIARFYERRARRILPALCLVMLCCIPFAWAWMAPFQMRDFSESLIATGLFASNILFWRETDYFAAAAEEKPLLHTWSLAVEEQFYLGFPILLLLLWRFGRQRTLYVVIGLSAGSLLLSEWGWRTMPAANFYMLPTRIWELGAGAICAFASQGREQRESSLLSLSGLALILFAIFFYDKTTPFPSLYALAPVGGAALVILYTGPSTVTARLLSLPPFVGIGLISYSAYLWHQPLFAFAKLGGGPHPGGTVMAILTAVTFVLAYGTWKFVETPFRRSFFPAVPSHKLVPVFALVLIPFIVLGGAGRITGGFTDLLTSDVQRQVLSTAAASPLRGKCHNKPPEEACTYFSDNYRWAVLGNSHGTELSFALADRLRRQDIGLKQFTVSSCPPSFGQPANLDRGDGCMQWESKAMDLIINDDRIETVVLSYRHDIHTGERAARSYTDLIQTLVNAGKRTIVVLQAPVLETHIQMHYRTYNDRNLTRAGLTRKDWDTRYAVARAALADIPDEAVVVDPADLFCSHDECFSIIAGTALYTDDNHMSIHGAGLVADGILRRVPVVVAREEGGGGPVFP